MTTTTQFREVRTPSGRVAYEAWTAVWRNNNRNVAISAPTLADLEREWKSLTTLKLDPAQAQHVYIVKFEDRSDKTL